MLLLLALLLQAPPATPPAPATSLERVKRELARQPSPFEVPAPKILQPGDRPMFRVEVREHRLVVEPLWKDDHPAPAWVRPRMPLSHYEFLSQVTPQEFRAATLYPCCVDMIAVYKELRAAIEKARRKRAQARAREEVQQALRELKAARK
jgi:hypothetical protein